jgi:hypothetical protein
MKNKSNILLNGESWHFWKCSYIASLLIINCHKYYCPNYVVNERCSVTWNEICNLCLWWILLWERFYSEKYEKVVGLSEICLRLEGPKEVCSKLSRTETGMFKVSRTEWVMLKVSIVSGYSNKWMVKVIFRVVICTYW